jgi:cytochrome c-type biogenesis protein CcmH/NrfG
MDMEKQMTRQNWFFLFFGFMIGSLVGFAIGFFPSFQRETTRGKETKPSPPTHPPSTENEKKERIRKTLEMLTSKLKEKPNDYQTLVQIANVYLNSGQYKKAATFYQKALAISGTDTNVMVHLGIAFKNMGDIPAASAQFQKAYEKDSANWQALYHLIITKIQQKTDAQKIGELYHKLMQLKVKESQIPWDVALTYYSLQEYSQAILYFQKTLELSPNSWNCLYYLANAYEQTNQQEQAIKTYEKILGLLPPGHQTAMLEKKIQKLKAAEKK